MATELWCPASCLPQYPSERVSHLKSFYKKYLYPQHLYIKTAKGLHLPFSHCEVLSNISRHFQFSVKVRSFSSGGKIGIEILFPVTQFCSKFCMHVFPWFLLLFAKKHYYYIVFFNVSFISLCFYVDQLSSRCSILPKTKAHFEEIRPLSKLVISIFMYRFTV